MAGIVVTGTEEGDDITIEDTDVVAGVVADPAGVDAAGVEATTLDALPFKQSELPGRISNAAV